MFEITCYAKTVPEATMCAENVGVAEPLPWRRRVGDRDRKRWASRAPDLPVDATPPDRGGAEDASLIGAALDLIADYEAQQNG